MVHPCDGIVGPHYGCDCEDYVTTWKHVNKIKADYKVLS